VKKWVVTILAALAFMVLALTAHWWAPWLLSFAVQNKERIDRLNSLAELVSKLVSWLGTAILLVLGLWQRKKDASDRRAQAVTVQGSGAVGNVSTAGRGVQTGGIRAGRDIVGGDSVSRDKISTFIYQTVSPALIPAVDHQDPALSAEARQLLLEGSADGDGAIMCVEVNEGLILRTNGKQLAEVGNRRSEAKWKRAVADLQRLKLLERLGGDGDVFQVTGEGYEVADRLQGGSNSQPHTPDISGRWEGWSYRSLTEEWVPAAQEFKQDGKNIVANAWGPRNWAHGLTASIVHDGATYQLIWSYWTESTGQGRLGDSHTGTHYFKYSERSGHKYLEGKYATDRVREDRTTGSAGFHRLIWVSRELKSALDFRDDAPWGLPKPAGPP
jgi:hypothetical protein